MVILENTYIHVHTVSRLSGTNCTHKPGTIETAQSTLTLNALICKTIKSQQLAYQFDFQFISTSEMVLKFIELRIRLVETTHLTQVE